MIFSLIFLAYWGFAETADFLDVQLMDVNTGKLFKLSDFTGKKILLETFAVWCPTCTRQQQQLAGLHNKLGDDVVIISLDVDPNEDELKIIQHTRQNNFDWIYAISPPELTQMLIRKFGTVVVVAPLTPIILINEDQDAKLLGRGVKSSSQLEEVLKGES